MTSLDLLLPKKLRKKSHENHLSQKEPKRPFQENVVIKSNVGKNKTRLEENILEYDLFVIRN